MMSDKEPTEWEKRRARMEADGAKEALRLFGFDVDDVHEMQKDIIFLRRIRTAQEHSSTKIAAGVIALIFGMIGVGLKALWDFFISGRG